MPDTLFDIGILTEPQSDVPTGLHESPPRLISVCHRAYLCLNESLTTDNNLDPGLAYRDGQLEHSTNWQHARQKARNLEILVSPLENPCNAISWPTIRAPHTSYPNMREGRGIITPKPWTLTASP